jgi:hypothetical protein
MKKVLEICGLTLFGLVSGIALIELAWLAYGAFLPLPNAEHEFGRYIYLYGGQNHVFKNYEGFYVFSPNDKIRVVGAHISTKPPVVEFDYNIKTNNFGLIGEQDLDQNIDSLLFIGDSFTAGQGAEPWLENISTEVKALNYQPINGGMVGAGFEQFARLDDFLTRNRVAIKKVMVIFISDDYTRKSGNMPVEALKCLEDITECDGSDVLYPAPVGGDLAPRLERIRQLAMSKEQELTEQEDTFNASAKRQLKRFLPASSLAYATLKNCINYGCLSFHLQTCPTQECTVSDSAIQRIVSKYGSENVLFVHLPEKSELGKGPNWIGAMARGAIAKAHGRLFDGIRECGLQLDDYHVIDGHPNARGYDKIANCIMNAATVITQSQRLQ